MLINSIPTSFTFGCEVRWELSEFNRFSIASIDKCDSALIPDAECQSSSLRLDSNLISFSADTVVPICFLRARTFGSCLTKHPKTTLTTLMALWVFIVLVIPNFSPFLAAYLRPIPTVYEVHENMRRLTGDLRQQSQEEVAEFIQEHGGDPAALSDAENKG